MNTEQPPNLTAVINASELLTVHAATAKTGEALADLGLIKGGAVVFDQNSIIAVGSTEQMLAAYQPESIIDAAGHLVMPGFVDPHHIWCIWDLVRRIRV